MTLQELLEVAKQAMPVPFRVDGPPLIYEFDDLPQINADGAYIDEAPPQKRKRVDGEDEESARKRRGSAGAKGTARNVSKQSLSLLFMPSLHLSNCSGLHYFDLQGLLDLSCSLPSSSCPYPARLYAMTTVFA